MYSTMELWDLAKQCKQRLGESVPAWLLHLWDDCADNTEFSPVEMGQLASITTIPSLQQRLQRNPPAGNQTLINWLMAPAPTVWENAGDLPEHMSKWTTYLDSVQVIREMGMLQMMFVPHYSSLDEELFTTCMEDMVLANGPSETCGTMVALLAPYMDRPVYEVTTALAWLGDVEVQKQGWAAQVWRLTEGKTKRSRALPDISAVGKETASDSRRARSWSMLSSGCPGGLGVGRGQSPRAWILCQVLGCCLIG
uniref:Uncharacterized protein n=1 Tax=Molossus molossus TaxID=27622 RepID=A0A7J8BYI5_MOLMO|nr:hypothetical protein HJG59_010050 [Molossus molossus]